MQVAEQPEAVAVGQVDVQNHQFGAAAGKGGFGIGTAGGGAHGFVARRVEVIRHKGEQVGVIIDKENINVVNGGHGCIPLHWC